LNVSHLARESDSAKLRAEVALIEAALREAAREAVQLHVRLGLPLVEWRNGQVVLVSPSVIAAEPPSP
jgi:hypothetical protein